MARVTSLGSRAAQVAIAWTAHPLALPSWVVTGLTQLGLDVQLVASAEDVLARVQRSRPEMVLVDARDDAERAGAALVTAAKRDAYMAVVPCVVLTSRNDAAAWLNAGADEVLEPDPDSVRGAARIAAALRRSVRDLSAQPTTRLPGAGGIDAELARRIAGGGKFAACYADLDHFKEYNDRYGFREGDRVIRMVARVLHDIAVGVAHTEAFVGHIGGDDFMVILPLELAAPVCELAIEVFDTLAPYQYSEADRRAGYYFGKDRRGRLHRVPLMTLSIGAATNERRRLDSVADVSRLASEMKSFAKARAGSVYAVDRRSELDPTAPPTKSETFP